MTPQSLNPKVVLNLLVAFRHTLGITSCNVEFVGFCNTYKLKRRSDTRPAYAWTTKQSTQVVCAVGISTQPPKPDQTDYGNVLSLMIFAC